MNFVDFFIEYVKSPRSIGAILPSSRKLANKMVSHINFNNASCIVEYGSGTGIFTDKLVENKLDNTKLILIENNKYFCEKLEYKYANFKNIFIINDSAENIDKHLNNLNITKVDYVVSGLPFTSLPENVSDKILNKTENILRNNGLFITFQYTLLKKQFILNYFDSISFKRVMFNIPPAYVFRCQKGSRYKSENNIINA